MTPEFAALGALENPQTFSLGEVESTERNFIVVVHDPNHKFPLYFGPFTEQQALEFMIVYDDEIDEIDIVELQKSPIELFS